MANIKKILLITLAVIVVLWLVIMLYNVVLTKPAIIGVVNGKLQKCPNKPNCVCSMISKSGDSEHYIDPFKYMISEV